MCNVRNITNVIAGEFGIVYRGNRTGWRAAREQGLVAVKTPKGICEGSREGFARIAATIDMESFLKMS